MRRQSRYVLSQIFSQFLVVLSFLLSVGVAHAGSCEEILSSLIRYSLRPAYASSAELEIRMSPALLEILTTENGKVSGIIPSDLALPVSFQMRLRMKSPLIHDVKEVEWERLSSRLKLDLLNFVAKNRKISFWQDREFHGLKVKDELTLKFTKPTDFLGVHYLPGTHTIRVKDVLGFKVEYLAPVDGNLPGLELHFRSSYTSAGDVILDAWKFEQAVDLTKTHQHIHIVAPVPTFLKESPEYGALVLGDYYRRVNLAVEMMGIVYEEKAIRPNKTPKGVFFDSLNSEMLRGIVSYLKSLGAGNPMKIGDRYKMGWVGFRGPDKYDTPNLWGLEYRAIGATADPNKVQNLGNSIQTSMMKEQFGTTVDQMRDWHILVSESAYDTPESLLGSTYYNKSWNTLLQEAPKEIKEKLTPELEKVLEAIKKTERVEVKMLFHDWSKDPIFYDDPAFIKKVLIAQIRAIDSLAKLDLSEAEKVYEADQVNYIVSSFLYDSGLLGWMMLSINANL